VAEIKSTLELALEKAEQYGRSSKDELLLDQYREQARQLAVNYLREEGDLEAGIQNLPPGAQDAARTAAKEVLLRNITLPREGELDPRQSRALEGLLLLASNKKAMARLKAEVEQIWQNFLMARNSAFQQLKANFSHSLDNMARAMEAQLRQKVRLDVEQLPQFQEEWRKFQNSLINQFEPILDDRKAQMLNL